MVSTVVCVPLMLVVVTESLEDVGGGGPENKASASSSVCGICVEGGISPSQCDFNRDCCPPF